MDFFGIFNSGDLASFARIAFQIFFYIIFFAIPIFLVNISWELWVRYRRSIFFNKQEYILLEIKIPKDVFKSPKAMEFLISALYTTLGEGNWYEKYWKGQVRSWYSLEIISIQGAVKFCIWTKKGDKNKIESNLYSQYPGIEIYEIPDYTLSFSYDPDTNNMWGTEFELAKPDAYPIKTYIDYGLDKDPEEEYKLDPITPLIEAMGSLGSGNEAWLQIVLRAHKAEDKDPVTGKMIDLKWTKAAEKEVESIIAKTKGEKGEDGKIIPGSNRLLMESESEAIKALQRSISKTGFDVGMRMIYKGEKDVFNMGNLGGLVGGVMHFNSPLNGFKLTGGSAPKHKNIFLLWKDRSKEVIDFEKRDILSAYKRRAFFHKPFERKHFVLNTEELATLFHFPGSVAGTPAFSRIESRKAEAPSNLPI